MINVKVHILRDGACVPRFATSGSAGADLFACTDDDILLPPVGRALIPTGIAVELPAHCAAFIYARSGLAGKHGICLANGVGVIDNDYRGEIKVALINLSDVAFTVKPGDRIAQMVVVPVPEVRFSQAETLSGSERGDGGFGSTGK